MDSEFPVFEEWLRHFAAQSTFAEVQRAEETAKALFMLRSGLGSEYGWRGISPEALAEEAKRAGTPDGINRVYWQDVARSVEAAGVVLLWRTCELVETAVPLLNARKALAPAILARSLLELGASAYENFYAIRKTIGEATEKWDNGVVTSPELEQLLVRMMYGTRHPGLAGHPQQKNVMTSIQKIAKNPAQAAIVPVYDFLCELAHPNVVGNARYWAEHRETDHSGVSMYIMSREPETPLTSQIRENALWALGWSAWGIGHCFVDKGQEAVQTILRRWPRTKGQSG